jgi:hypothetical protein
MSIWLKILFQETQKEYDILVKIMHQFVNKYAAF